MRVHPGSFPHGSLRAQIVNGGSSREAYEGLYYHCRTPRTQQREGPPVPPFHKKETAMPYRSIFRSLPVFWLAATLVASAQQHRLDLTSGMLVNESDVGTPEMLVDEQREIIGPPVGMPTSGWKIPSQLWEKAFPASVHLDLGAEKNLSALWVYDTNGRGDLTVAAGQPGQWETAATYDCGAYRKWVSIPLEVTTRYLRLTRANAGANISEIALYEYTPEAYREMVAQKVEEKRKAAEREAALKTAREEALKRPLVEFPPYGTLSLVDEVICSDVDQNRPLTEYPTGASSQAQILGRSCRVVAPVRGESSYISYRVGKTKLLRPGGAYVLAVEYPEDVPRTMVVINTGNETARGFHTGPTVGDALHAKYVNSLTESLDVPLSGKWETWSLLIRLHDRFPELGLVRGKGQRPLTPEDGFDVTVAQFSARNAPMSKGIAVGRIRLYEVIDPEKLARPLRLPPDGLPRRHLFWREEMADGVLGSKSTKSEDRGVEDRLDWYRYKADLMSFLGMNTFAKDLLEFGACQHWDSTPHGGNAWVYFDGVTKDLWGQIVELMGKRGFSVFPYYEYSGSKGAKGLGNERRCKPLTRDDAYTHIKWIETHNADITDPDTFEDFRKMLDITVVQQRRKARFVGAWIRSRGQMPVSFSDATRKRFSDEVNEGQAVTRASLQKDKALYASYLAWWQGKRRTFLSAMKDYLRTNGVEDAVVLYTGCAGEPGVGFGSWEPRMVTDTPPAWQGLLKQPEHITGKKEVIDAVSIARVVTDDLYLAGLTSPGLTWGEWEVQHSRPADDPLAYTDTAGVMLSHAFNRLYTVSSPRTFDAFRTPAGLALMRHYALNEHMLFDKSDKQLFRYFVADIERAGPSCMVAEAVAVANGDPTMIGYLAGCNYGRGFPAPVRDFNADFLALPALPSTVVHGACDDLDVVVRRVATPKHGTWIAVVNTGMGAKDSVWVRINGGGAVADAVTGREILVKNGGVALSMGPCQLRSLHVVPDK